MDLPKIIYDLKYCKEYDFDRKMSVLDKDNFLSKIVWKIEGDGTLTNKTTKKVKKLNLSVIEPFVCRIVCGRILNINFLYQFEDSEIKSNDIHIKEIVLTSYLKQKGFTNITPIKVLDKDYEYSLLNTKDITINEYKRVLSLTNCYNIFKEEIFSTEKLHFKFKESDFDIIEKAKQQIIAYRYTSPGQAEICDNILLGLDLIMFKMRLAINNQIVE